MPDPVLPLGDPVASEPSVSGGKGATLARLLALDLPVPDGVVVTTEVYRDLVDDAGIETLFEDLDEAVGSGEDDAQFEVAAAEAPSGTARRGNRPPTGRCPTIFSSLRSNSTSRVQT